MKKTEDTSGTALLRRTCSPGRIVAAVVCTALQHSGGHLWVLRPGINPTEAVDKEINVGGQQALPSLKPYAHPLTMPSASPAATAIVPQ